MQCSECNYSAVKPYRNLSRIAALALLGVLFVTHEARGAFPLSGVDVFPSGSPFSVTINGVTYTAQVNDPATTVGRGGVTIESGEGPQVVPTAGCTACATLVNDSDIGCYPIGADTLANRRELHTEMLSLKMCGPTMDGHVVCYLAGQPAADALAGRVPGQSNYRNSFGEVYSLDPTGTPALDFPATSFWAVRGVVTITPAPPGTSGVFFSKTPVLMSFSPIDALPPPVDAVYHNQGGTTAEGGGAACGSLPNLLYDAGSVGGPPPADVAVGQVNCGAVHSTSPSPDFGKWEQPPDLTNGLDVLATFPTVVGDDWLCTLTGPITDIHIWGSWLSNHVDPNAQFLVSIWTDVTNQYSHPGVLLCSNWFGPCDYQYTLYATNAHEQFYDPNINQVIGPDSDVWFYSFFPTNPCWQIAGHTYWLVVMAVTSSPTNVFGWKTSTNHWHDDAVYGHFDDLDQVFFQDWIDMHYPPGHPYGTNTSIDLAFRLTTPPTPGGEIDQFVDSIGGFTLVFPDSHTEFVTVQGPNTVKASVGPKGQTSAQNPNNGLDQVPTEMLSMDLAGVCSLGTVSVRVRSPNKPPFSHSTGLIEETVNTLSGRLDMPPFAGSGIANSYFDIFFEVELDSLLGPTILHNGLPHHVSTPITHKPPNDNPRYNSSTSTPLLTESNVFSGFSIQNSYHDPNGDTNRPPRRTSLITLNYGTWLVAFGPNQPSSWDGLTNGWWLPTYPPNGEVIGYINTILIGVDPAPQVPYPYPLSQLAPPPSQGGPLTTYYFQPLSWDHAPNGVVLVSSNYLDDGAVFYLNPGEIGRIRVNGNPVTYSSLAQPQLNEGVLETLTFLTNNLVRGVNYLGVEVHSTGTNDNDYVFGMSLDAYAALPPRLLDPALPADQIVPTGAPLTLTASADGMPFPAYQWNKNGTNMAGATGSSFSVGAAVAGNAGSYYCRVTNSLGAIATRTATVQVLALLRIQKHPTLQNTLIVSWSGAGTLQFTPILKPANWQTVTGATSPYTLVGSNSARYYRLIGP